MDELLEALNNAPKFVASNTLTEPLPWPNSALLDGDVAEAVAKLKIEKGGDLQIMGSGDLIRSLMPHGLIDEFLLMIHPFVLGSGQRLFDEVIRQPDGYWPWTSMSPAPDGRSPEFHDVVGRMAGQQVR